MKKLIKRHIRRSIVRSLGYPIDLHMAKQYAEYVFDAPMRGWPFRLRIVKQFGQDRSAVTDLKRVSDFIRGEVKEVVE